MLLLLAVRKKVFLQAQGVVTVKHQILNLVTHFRSGFLKIMLQKLAEIDKNALIGICEIFAQNSSVTRFVASKYRSRKHCV